MCSSEDAKMSSLAKVKLDRQALFYLNMCARCGVCKDACHIYSATKDPKHMPAYRAELLRRVLKRQIGWSGGIFPSLNKVTKLDENTLDELYQAAYTCTGCRRCMVYCPYGIDVGYLMGVAKRIIVKAGKAPEVLEMLADAAIEKGTSIDDFREFFKEQLSGLESEVQRISGIPDARIPVDKQGANVLYVALAGAHSITPAAVVFNAAKEDWTLSVFDAANYGYFLGDTQRAAQIANRIVAEAKALGVKTVALTECGHSYRVLKHLQEAWSGEKFTFVIVSALQLFAEYIQQNRIKLDPAKTPQSTTYHDPCQLGRNGGVFEEPRIVVKALSKDYREMLPNRGDNWCCGGGGGLIAQMELEEFRAQTGRAKAEQIRQTGAKIVATPCENCRIQLALLNDRYDLDIEVKSVMDLVVNALVVT